jgi:hypothetical protein
MPSTRIIEKVTYTLPKYAYDSFFSTTPAKLVAFRVQLATEIMGPVEKYSALCAGVTVLLV